MSGRARSLPGYGAALVIRATYEKSVFRPDEPVDIADGERVHLPVDREAHADYEAAKQRALARLHEGYRLGGKPLSREEIDRR